MRHWMKVFKMKQRLCYMDFKPLLQNLAAQKHMQTALYLLRRKSLYGSAPFPAAGWPSLQNLSKAGQQWGCSLPHMANLLYVQNVSCCRVVKQGAPRFVDRTAQCVDLRQDLAPLQALVCPLLMRSLAEGSRVPSTLNL